MGPGAGEDGYGVLSIVGEGHDARFVAHNAEQTAAFGGDRDGGPER